jgi:hypothetical protein
LAELEREKLVSEVEEDEDDYPEDIIKDTPASTMHQVHIV